MPGPYTPFGWYTPQQPTDPDMLRKAMAALVARNTGNAPAAEPYEPFGWYKEPTTPGYFGNQATQTPIPPGLNKELAQSPITPLPRMMPGGLTEQEAANEALAKRAAIEKLAQDRGIDRQQALVGIGESLGNMEITTPGSIMYGQKQQPFLADAARAKLERMQDEMTEGDRKAFSAILSEALGKQLEIPRGMSWTRAKQFFPAFSNLALGQGRMDNPLARLRAETAAGGLALKEKQFDYRTDVSDPTNWRFRERNTATGEKRAKIAEDRATRLKEATDIILADMQTTDETVNMTKDVYEKVKDNLGPIRSRIMSAVGKWFGEVDPPEFRQLEFLLFNLVQTYLKSVQGARPSDYDVQMYMKNFASTIDSPERFYAQIETFQNLIHRRQDNLISVLEGSGYEVPDAAKRPDTITTQETTEPTTTSPHWKGIKPPTGGPLHPSPEQGMKWMISPKGVKRQVTLEEAKTLSELGWSEGTP